jgi:hypothetical protein
MTVENDEGVQPDLLSEISDVEAVRLLLADMHDDLQGKVARLRYMNDLSVDLGTEGTMLFGGQTTYHAWAEARSSFIHGNYVATIVLCQSLAENLLAAFAQNGSTRDGKRVQFSETLDQCQAIGLLSDHDVGDLKRLSTIRNPLTHFRHINDEHNLSRRSMTTGNDAGELLRSDAWFAIGLAVRTLAKKPFRVGP